MVWLPACKTGIMGNGQQNQPPETHTIIDTIIRTGANRLNSEVHIRWWGDDPDGFVKGYEFAFDNGPWTFTTLNDSVFILSPPPGEDTVDFNFKVRAMDNEGMVDPTPASVVYPVKNSPPSVHFVAGTQNPTFTFPIIRFFWKGEDTDGEANLNRYELIWNDTTQQPVEVDINTSGAIFEALSMQAGPTETYIYRNNNDNPEPETIPGFVVNDTNRLYIRVIDNSDAESSFIASYPVYVRPVRSDVLLVNGDDGNVAAETFYVQHINSVGIAPFDTLRFFEKVGGSYSQQAADNLTQRKIFALFHTIIWYSNKAATSLSIAQRTTTDFFGQGGKMLMSIYVSSTFDEQSQFFDFTPVESLVSPPDTTLLLDNGAQLTPLQSGWPTLSSTSIVGVVKPMILSIGATPLYDAELLARDNPSGSLGPWTGKSTVVAKQAVGGQTNFVFSTLELHKLDGNTNMDQFFQKVLKDEFGL